MTGSFKKINYRLRPAKHAERFMLCDLFRRFRFAPIETYQYVGFGSVGFIDFRIMNRHLGIKDMFSVEDTNDPNEQDRFSKNKPYDGLQLIFGHSNTVLPTLNFKRKSLVWLDYDDLLSRTMVLDIETVVRELASGSFLGVTFTGAFPSGALQRKSELARLKGQFPEFVTDQTKAQQFDSGRIAEFGRATLGALLQRALSDADAGKPAMELRRAQQVCYFKYSDGAPMVTVGWLIVAREDEPNLEASQIDTLPFARTDSKHFRISIPLITPYEVIQMERRFPDLLAAEDLNWIPIEEKHKFQSIQRYLPHFSAVEPT